jgi:PAS domain S-box-containing protein
MVDEFGQERLLAPRFPITVLLIEDSPDDAELCLRVLRKAQFGIQADVVRTAEKFVERLGATSYDVILADYNLGNWTGIDALHLLHTKQLDIPFILVTGALGEQAAVECLKNGVTDYILKDRMERLAVAIHRAIEEKSLRNERRRAEELLFESEAKFRLLTEATPVAVFVEQDTRCCYVNYAAERITGYSRQELLGMNFWQLVHPRSRKELTERSTKGVDAGESTCRAETQILNKKGEERWLDVSVATFQIKGKLAALIAALDITDRERQKVSYLVE